MRGDVFGHECLGDALGEDEEGLDPAPEPRRVGSAIAGAAFVGALVLSALPWSRFGQGSGLLGGWELPFRWSALAGVAAAVGAVGWLATAWAGRRPGPVARLALEGLAALVGLASLLWILQPPSFTRPSLVPYLSLALGLVALLGLVRAAPRSAPRVPRRV